MLFPKVNKINNPVRCASGPHARIVALIISGLAPMCVMHKRQPNSSLRPTSLRIAAIGKTLDRYMPRPKPSITAPGTPETKCTRNLADCIVILRMAPTAQCAQRS